MGIFGSKNKIAINKKIKISDSFDSVELPTILLELDENMGAFVLMLDLRDKIHFYEKLTGIKLTKEDFKKNIATHYKDAQEELDSKIKTELQKKKITIIIE